HARLIANALEKVLGRAHAGAVAFVRCLTPEVVEALARDTTFSPASWGVWRVADREDATQRTVTADHAVELRESKGDPLLFVVDTARAGAGMDGIYSAAQEVNENGLFGEVLRLAGNEVTRRLSRDARVYAERAIKKARGFGHRLSISPWTEFDFLVRIAAER